MNFDGAGSDNSAEQPRKRRGSRGGKKMCTPTELVIKKLSIHDAILADILKSLENRPKLWEAARAEVEEMEHMAAEAREKDRKKAEKKRMRKLAKKKRKKQTKEKSVKKVQDMLPEDRTIDPTESSKLMKTQMTLDKTVMSKTRKRKSKKVKEEKEKENNEMSKEKGNNGEVNIDEVDLNK